MWWLSVCVISGCKPHNYMHLLFHYERAGYKPHTCICCSTGGELAASRVTSLPQCVGAAASSNSNWLPTHFHSRWLHALTNLHKDNGCPALEGAERGRTSKSYEEVNTVSRPPLETLGLQGQLIETQVAIQQLTASYIVVCRPEAYPTPDSTSYAWQRRQVPYRLCQPKIPRTHFCGRWASYSPTPQSS